MRMHPTHPDCYLLTPADLAEQTLPPHLQRYTSDLREIELWTRSFLCSPHPELGREGSVCPYTKPSLERNLFWMTVFAGSDLTAESVYNVVVAYRQWFMELEPLSGREAQYKTILVLFPDLDMERAPGIIDMMQHTLKPEFVAQGLMIGQFHFGCNEPGLWNDDFRPLRTTVPMLVIRHMVATDFPFLKKTRDWVDMYLQRFAGQIPRRIQATVAEVAYAYGLNSGFLDTPQIVQEIPNLVRDIAMPAHTHAIHEPHYAARELVGAADGQSGSD